jgi:hypothetical protein
MAEKEVQREREEGGAKTPPPWGQRAPALICDVQISEST